jgi:hypothetical protein
MMESRNAAPAPPDRGHNRGPCRLILWLADPRRAAFRSNTAALWRAGGWLLVPSLLGLLGSLLLAPLAPVWSLVLLVAAMLGAAGFLWIAEHVQAAATSPLIKSRS